MVFLTMSAGMEFLFSRSTQLKNKQGLFYTSISLIYFESAHFHEKLRHIILKKLEADLFM